MKMTYESYLKQYGTLTYRNVGVSMLPLLREGKDLFTITRKGKKRCKKYDVVLYRRPPASYVLHRIVKVREHDYVLLGDNCLNKEYGIRDDDILGVMTTMIRGGKEISVQKKTYQFLVRVWYFLYPLRAFFMRFKYYIKRGNHP